MYTTAPATTSNTGVVLIDPHNDFLHPKGKMTPGLQASLDDSNTISHIKDLLTAARKAKIPVYYGLHRQTTFRPPVFIPLHSGYLQDRNAAKSLRQLSVPWVDCHRKVRYTSNKYNSKH